MPHGPVKWCLTTSCTFLHHDSVLSQPLIFFPLLEPVKLILALGILQLLFPHPKILLPSSLHGWFTLIIQVSVQMSPFSQVFLNQLVYVTSHTQTCTCACMHAHKHTHTLTPSWVIARPLYFIFFKALRCSCSFIKHFLQLEYKIHWHKDHIVLHYFREPRTVPGT